MLYPVPGDWHIMKTTAEVIKMIIQDGDSAYLLGNVGSTRIFKYIRQYTLTPPTEIRQKRRRMKMKTFTPCTSIGH